ncbi:hypothetical protein [Rhizosaccharibacter radicis]|uniref:Uncharacterized protein n=1 Tax=Rhizosaccharibacter radicis TaxID=2782605 RepID=A0ABT1W1K3_9PROT|nr:hypothetical protein [Acetobacteraceae bacterium KSS12]
MLTLKVENGTGRLALYGSLDVTRDQQGLAHPRALPHTIAAPEKPKTVKNLFARPCS